MSKPKKPNKPGRPQGATTKQRDIRTAVITVDKCPKCGCEKPPKNKRLLRKGDATTTINGIKCGSFRHFTAECADPNCGKAFLYREFTSVAE